MPGNLVEPLVELIERMDRQYQEIFAQRPPVVEDVVGPAYEKFQERARGFKRAAALVAQSIMQNSNLFNFEMLPAAVFLFRHSIELNLKSIRSQLSDSVSSSYRFGRSHELIELWTPVEAYLKESGFQFEDGHPHYRIARAIKELSDLDRDGQLFRYPDSNLPAAANWIRVSLENLRLSATEVDLLAFGFSDLIAFNKNANSCDASERRE